MTNLFLNAGDKVHLPNTVVVNGKTCMLFQLNCHKSKQIKGFILIQNELSQIKSSIEKHITNPSHDFEQLRSSVITYRKLWKDTGSRFVKLEAQRDLKQVEEKLLNLHHELILIGDKYIAHPDETDYEQSFIHLIVDEGKAVGVCCLNMNLQNFDENRYCIWLELINSLKNSIEKTIEKMKKILIDEYNFSH